MTYLNFNDFKTKLIKQPIALHLPTSKAILKASFSSGLPSKTMSLWEPFKEYRKVKSLDSRDVFAAEVLRKDLGRAWELLKEHPFLSYAFDYWLHHSAYFDQKTTQTWRLWEKLLLFEDGPAQIPSKATEWAQRTRTISRWISDHEHVPLLSIIVSSETPIANAEKQYILNISIERQSLRLLDFIILRESLCSRTVLNESLVKAAAVVYLEAAERLIVAEADINCRSRARYGGLNALQAAAKEGIWR